MCPKASLRRDWFLESCAWGEFIQRCDPRCLRWVLFADGREIPVLGLFSSSLSGPGGREDAGVCVAELPIKTTGSRQEANVFHYYIQAFGDFYVLNNSEEI